MIAALTRFFRRLKGTNVSDFTYDKMTPELRAYLDHPSCPRSQWITEEGKHVQTKESKAEQANWEEEHEALKAKIASGEIDAYDRARRIWMCRDETQSGEPRVETSPSGKYRLVVTGHSTGKDTWNYTKARVYEGDRLIETVCRNYNNFPATWLEGHTNKDYLICGEDYQGQTVIELSTGKRVDYTPKGAEEGFGFCWMDHHPNPSGTLLAVEGCYWACPYETLIVDFANPMSPPYLILGRVDDGDHFGGWADDETCRFETEHEYVNLPGHYLHDKINDHLTHEESMEVEAECKRRGLDYDEEEYLVEREGATLWTKPSDIEILTNWLKESAPHWQDHNKGEVPDDFNDQLALLSIRCGGYEAVLGALSEEARPLYIHAAADSYRGLSARREGIPAEWLQALKGEGE